MQRFQSTKKYGFEEGLSIAYRQWRADSHCRFIHGYAIALELTFECVDLDVRNWCTDFGGLKPIKEVLKDQFDHTLLVAQDDPKLQVIRDLQRVHKIAKVIELEHLGSEQLAKLVYEFVAYWLKTDGGYGDRVHLVKVQLWETPTNSATFIGPDAPWDTP